MTNKTRVKIAAVAQVALLLVILNVMTGCGNKPPSDSNSSSSAPMPDDQYFDYLKTKSGGETDPSNKVEYMQSYLNAYPRGKHMGEATALLEMAQKEPVRRGKIPSSPQETQASDPVATLREHIRQYQVYETANPYMGYHLTDLKYDVQRSQSLVSPYLAYVLEVGEKDGDIPMIMNTRITLAFQEGRWAVTDVQYRFDRFNDGESGLGEWQPMTVFDAIQQHFGL